MFLATRQKIEKRDLPEAHSAFPANDIDPEDELPEFEEPSGSEVEDDGAERFDGREHYAEVGKSKLRGADPIRLGTQYAGSKTRRKAIEDEDEEDDPFAEYGSGEVSDEINDQFEGLSGESMDENTSDEAQDHEADDIGDIEDMRSDSELDPEMVKDEYGLTNDSRKRQIREDNERVQLKALVAKEISSINTSLAASQRADAQKGLAVRQQRQTFDSLLTSRIRVQNALVATNTLSTVTEQTPASEIKFAASAAENAARALWVNLDSLRCSLLEANSGTKRKRSSPTEPVGNMWQHMNMLETSFLPQRRATLAKWSEKTASNAAKRAKSSLTGNAPQAETSLLDVLDGHLGDTERLVKKARIPRSAAPVQAQEYAAMRRAQRHDADISRRDNEIEEVYDDADFYGALLKDLIAQRQSEGSSNVATALPTKASTTALDLETEYQNASQKSAAMKKAVDTRASKGRKMRYTVHEKLVNFMVPEDRGNWADRQRSELFASLFGQRRAASTNGAVREDEIDGQQDDVEQALRLFRG